MTVAADTPTSYQLRFRTAGGDTLSPNLKAPTEYKNANLVTAGSSVDVPLGRLILTAAYVSSSAISLSIRAADPAKPVLVDIRRTGIYNGASVRSQTNDSTTITGTITLDDTVYSQSQEIHWTRIRQQDPDSGLWSMCVVDTFASGGGARTTISVKWYYTGATFAAPQ